MNENMKEYLWWIIPVVVAIGVAVALYYGRKQQAIEPAAEVAQEIVTPAQEEPIRNPIEPTPPEEPLPDLRDSDTRVRGSLDELFGRALAQYLVPENIVRNIVVTIDNLPREKTNAQRWPLKPTTGELATRGTDEEYTLSEENFKRYAPLVALVKGADTAQLASTYKQLYPLFQQAYEDLGYPDGYFNDRLIEVIDHLLETPDIQAPIALTRPSVYYEFADPALEARSSGQKILLRMGSEQAAAVKAKLRELRREVATQSAPAG